MESMAQLTNPSTEAGRKAKGVAMLSELIDAVRNAQTREQLNDYYMAARHVARAEGAMFELAEAWSAADNRLPEIPVEPLIYFG